MMNDHCLIASTLWLSLELTSGIKTNCAKSVKNAKLVNVATKVPSTEITKIPQCDATHRKYIYIYIDTDGNNKQSGNNHHILIEHLTHSKKLLGSITR